MSAGASVCLCVAMIAHHQQADFWDKAEMRGTHLLDWAIANPLPNDQINATMVVQACGLLEGVLSNRDRKPTSLFKNLVSCRFPVAPSPPRPPHHVCPTAGPRAHKAGAVQGPVACTRAAADAPRVGTQRHPCRVAHGVCYAGAGTMGSFHHSSRRQERRLLQEYCGCAFCC